MKRWLTWLVIVAACSSATEPVVPCVTKIIFTFPPGEVEWSRVGDPNCHRDSDMILPDGSLQVTWLCDCP